MTYGKNTLALTQLDFGFQKHIGYESTVENDKNFLELFSPSNILMIQRKITELLQGLREDGRPILVVSEIIGSVMTQCYQSNIPEVGSIYSRYIQESNRDDFNEIINRTINIIVTQIRNEYETEINNNKLTKWSALLGDFNLQGLRSHPQIKLNERRPKLNFMWNY